MHINEHYIYKSKNNHQMHINQHYIYKLQNSANAYKSTLYL